MSAVAEALMRHPIEGASSAPSPDVIMTGIRDGMAVYAARYWLTDLERDLMVDTEVRARVTAGLERAQLPIGIPRGEMNLSRERDENARVFARLRKRALEAISRVDIFSSLTPEERAELASRLRFVPFGVGEAILVQGETGEYLVVLSRGSAEVTVAVDGGEPSRIATLEAPDFCGEFGMLTGERRQASVLATTEVDAWRLSRDDFQEILAQRPAISEEVSRVLAERVVALRAARENLSEQARVTMVANQHRSIRDRIERFFGLDG
jgi:CRP-like cAMP-binding protein